MKDSLHWLLFILVFVTLGLFFVTHSDAVSKLMSAGVTDLNSIETGFASFATTAKE